MVRRGQGQWDGFRGGRTAIFSHSEFVAHSCFVFLQLTFVDFLAYDVLDRHRIFEPTCLDEFPNLKDFTARFEVIPLVLLVFISLFSSLYFLMLP